MIRAPFDDPAVQAKLRPAFAASRSLILPAACDPAALGRVRWGRFDLANRGKYEAALLRDGGLARELREFAEGIAGARLMPRASLRLYRFRRGGYALFYDDAISRISAGIEVTLDLSRQMAGPPAVYQSGPTEVLEIPQVPGLVAVVERGPMTYRYDRYLPAAVGRATVVRLRAAFRFAD